jgi:hypothetical protein
MIRLVFLIIDSVIIHLFGMHSLGTIVFLGKLLVSQKLGVHTLATNVTVASSLLDAVGVCLVRVIMRTCVLLL